MKRLIAILATTSLLAFGLLIGQRASAASQMSRLSSPLEHIGWWQSDETASLTSANTVGRNDSAHVGGSHPAPNPGTITPTVNTPFEFIATGSGSFTFSGEDRAEFLGPNWRFTMRFFSTGSFIGINPFIFEHNSFLGAEGLSNAENAAGTGYLYGTPSTFHFEFTYDLAHGRSVIHTLSSHYDEFSVVGDIEYNGQNDFRWSATFRATHVPGASTHGCVTPPSNLVGWWPLDEIVGQIAADIVDGNNGAHVGGPTSVAGHVAGALSFDGVNDEVVVNSTFPFHQPGDATLEFWLNTPATGHQSVFWTRADDADLNRFNIFVNGNSTFGFDYRSPSGAIHVLVGTGSTGVSIPRNTWTHLAITRTANVYNFYVNGVLAASATDVVPDLPTATGWQMSGRGGFMYRGSLDEVEVYNRALSASEIQAIYNAGSLGKCKPDSADLAITKVFTSASVLTGSPLTSTITVTNNGPAAATNITVTDNLPASTTFLSCSATSGGICSGSGNNCTVTFASLAAGSSATITLEAVVGCSVTNGTEIVNTATVSSSLPDSNTSNNSMAATATALNPPPVITCPMNVSTAGNVLGSCSATVNPGTAAATDNCSGVTVVGVRSDGQPLSAQYPSGVTTITWTAMDSGGRSASCQQTVTVNNPNPVVTITGPPSGAVYAVGAPVNFTGAFTNNPGGTHTANWMFDAINQAGTVNKTTGAVNTTYTFTSAGVYMVKLATNDGCGGAGLADTIDGLTAMVVIYDPNGGFVTGGGWINSPAGAYSANPSLTGKANFGFVSKYQQGATVPTGQTEFQFKVAGLNFHSTVYDWLVVAGARAQYKGTGTINGNGNYGFLLMAIDGQVSGGGGTDKFRIKIWDKDNNGAIVYDNKIGSSDNSNDATELGGGSIVIHK